MSESIASRRELESDLQRPLVILDCMLTALSILFVVGRFGARLRKKVSFGWDDWLILIAAAITIPQLACNVLATHYGLGRHVQDVSETQPDYYHGFLKYTWLMNLLYMPIISLIKLSILCLYIRIFGSTLRLVCFIEMAFVAAWGIAASAVLFGRCVPMWKIFELDQSGAHCIDYSMVFLGMNTFDVMLCIAILITPLPLIWNLHLDKTKKILVSIAFILGGGETVFSVIRLIVLSKLDWNRDATYNWATYLMWSAVQEKLGVVCACAPVMAPLLPRNWTVPIPSTWRSYLSSSTGRRTDKIRNSTFGSSRKFSGSQRRTESRDSQTELFPQQDGIKATTEVTIVTEDREVIANQPRRSSDIWGRAPSRPKNISEH